MDETAAAATDDTTSTGTGAGGPSCDDRWAREASRDPVLAAAEIYFMACPAERVPWRDLLRMSRARARGRGGASPEDLFRRPPPPPEGWARRRSRRRPRRGQPWKAAPGAGLLKPCEEEEDEQQHLAPAAAAPSKEEPRRMDSPTTPLSWTTAAASSGSGSGGSEAAREDDAVTTAAAAVKRRRSDAAEGIAAAAQLPTAAPAPAPAVPSSSYPAAPARAVGPGEDRAAGATASRSVLGPTEATGTTATDGAAPLPMGSGDGGGYVASISKTTRLLLGKKMTLVELKCYEQSLLQKNMEMRKELEIQKKAQEVLVEENTRLKLLKSKHQPQAARQPLLPSKREEAVSENCPFLPFDLNMPPTEEM